MSTIGSNTGATSDVAAPLQVRDIGSFHVGGQTVSLTGMAPRLRVSTAHGAVHPVDPNGEMIVGGICRDIDCILPEHEHPEAQLTIFFSGNAPTLLSAF